MLTKNMDVEKGLVNGARGVIKGFDSKGKGYSHTVAYPPHCTHSYLGAGE